MKVKTSELSGMALCYTVCMIEMPHLVWGKTVGEHHASKQIVVPELPGLKCYSPFMSWEMFGPIIERELIDVCPYEPQGRGWRATRSSADYSPAADPQNRYYAQFGPTALIAAMRCYVASKLGCEVEIPSELI